VDVRPIPPENFHDGKRFCVIDGHRLGKGVRRPDLIMDIINTDAEDTNLLTLFVFRQCCLASTARVLAFSLIRRLPSFGPRRGHEQLSVSRHCRLVSPLTDGRCLQPESLRVFWRDNLGQFQHDLRNARGILRNNSEWMKACCGIGRNGQRNIEVSFSSAVSGFGVRTSVEHGDGRARLHLNGYNRFISGLDGNFP
jgi:hypothetical protein